MMQIPWSMDNCCENSASPSAGTAPDLVILLLAGGDGTRLQELTRQITGIPIPKQYCRLLRGSSLLEATLARAYKCAARERIRVIINQNHLDLARTQLSALPESNIFVQPLNRDTGPGMAFALLRLAQTHPDAIVAVFPTDHYISDDRVFNAHVLRAADIVSCLPEKIVLLGVVPDRPETAYGYVLRGEPLGAAEILEKTYNVSAFVEKPSPAAAKAIISHRGLWNTFVMVFRLSRMLQLVRELVPSEFRKLSELLISPNNSADLYQTLECWNLSTDVLARIPQHLILLETEGFAWSDWGTRESIERTYKALNVVPFWNLPKPAAIRIAGRRINPTTRGLSLPDHAENRACR